ncbi:hypothetical protein [Mumia quercus]|uniref:hypothetical protein n=1 Tax=Mumia quercus TaxID=2976125 RepID=UPI0021D158A6|nr:hypothetical protein [Mumia quercus]
MHDLVKWGGGVGALVLTITGCAGSPPVADSTAVRPAVDEAVLTGAGFRSFDYQPVASPRELSAACEVVVAGRVASWAAGVDAYDDEDHQAFAILAVDVDDAIAGESAVHDGRVFVRVIRGYEVVEDKIPVKPADAPATVTSIADLEKAAPVGTRVAITGNVVDRLPHGDDPAWTQENADAGLPKGAAVIQPSLQGLLLEDADGQLVSGIVDDDPTTWGAAWTPTVERTGKQRTTPYGWLVAELGEGAAS